jgi:hypothetical protein
MKDFVIAVALYLVLTVMCSLTSFPEDTFPPLGSIGTKYPGDTGMVLPGGGDSQAEVMVKSEEHRSTEPEESKEQKDPGKTEEAEASASDASEAESQIPIDIEMKEKNKMGDMLLVFWHGVATVLIGETVALMVCIAWMKIKGEKYE